VQLNEFIPIKGNQKNHHFRLNLHPLFVLTVEESCYNRFGCPYNAEVQKLKAKQEEQQNQGKNDVSPRLDHQSSVTSQKVKKPKFT